MMHNGISNYAGGRKMQMCSVRIFDTHDVPRAESGEMVKADRAMLYRGKSTDAESNQKALQQAHLI